MGGQIKHALSTSAPGTLLSPHRPKARGLSRDLALVLLLMVFCAEAAIGLLVFHDLSRSSSEMQRMYERSVRGLRRIGEMQYEAQETRRSTLYALTTNDANLQVGYCDMSRAADRGVKEGISGYLAQGVGRQGLIFSFRSREKNVLDFSSYRARFFANCENLGLYQLPATRERIVAFALEDLFVTARSR